MYCIPLVLLAALLSAASDEMSMRADAIARDQASGQWQRRQEAQLAAGWSFTYIDKNDEQHALVVFIPNPEDGVDPRDFESVRRRHGSVPYAFESDAPLEWLLQHVAPVVERLRSGGRFGESAIECIRIIDGAARYALNAESEGRAPRPDAMAALAAGGVVLAAWTDDARFIEFATSDRLGGALNILP